MHLLLDMLRQPTDTSCGPTCLHAIYRFHGVDCDLERLIAEVPATKGGGTLSVYLAIHALQMGFAARIVSYNLKIFDPTWWSLSREEIARKIERRIAHLKGKKARESHKAYLDYLNLGGEMDFFDLSPESLAGLLRRGAPILAGLSATYLYQHPRELSNNEDDDVAGSPTGHFVVVTGWHEESQKVIVVDPFERNPYNPLGEYRVEVNRFINSVMLGIVTYDANLLMITRGSGAAPFS